MSNTQILEQPKFFKYIYINKQINTNAKLDVIHLNVNYKVYFQAITVDRK